MSFTTLPVAGQKIRAATVSALISELRPLSARKTSDETVNNSATLQDDNELFVAVEANKLYELNLHAVQQSGATPGFKLAFTMPAGASWVTGVFDCGSSAGNEQYGVMSAASLSGLTGAAANSNVEIQGRILTGANAGTVTLQWAQNTANGSDTIVRAGSQLTLRQLP